MEATNGSEAPEAYRRWAAIVAIGAVLEQSVWMQTKKSKLFPNLFALLVGPPGIGKSETVKAIRPYLEEAKVYLASTSVTAASIIDEMELAKREYAWGPIQGQHLKYYSMLLIPDELNTLLAEYDKGLVGMMTTLYDVGHYSERRRGTGKFIELTAPQLSILAGTTPSHLLNTLPERAWEEGFMSRTIIIYDHKAKREGDIFENAVDCYDEGLQSDFSCIANLDGQLSIGDSYRVAYKRWRDNQCKPEPTHPRLRTYCSRREAHLLKLSMVACVDEGSALHLEGRHFQRAYTWLTEAELNMSDVFDNAISPTGRALNEAKHKINGCTMTEGQIGRFLVDNKVSPSQTKPAIDMMINSGELTVVSVDANGQRTLKVRIKG